MNDPAGNAFRVARVRWQRGQVLLPEHLRAQEDALLDQVRLRLQLSGPPAYGVARLVLDEAALRLGVLAITELTAVLPDRTVLDCPTTGVLEPAQLALDKTGRTQVSVYLHVLQTETENQYEDTPQLPRLFPRAVLSTEPERADARLRALRLLVLEKNADPAVGWQLAEEYVPPLLRVEPRPFLRWLDAELVPGLGAVRQQIRSTLADPLNSLDRIADLRRSLVAVDAARCLLGDRQSVPPHPYSLFDALRSLYLELCCLRERIPSDDLPVYRHERLGEGFGALRQLLRPLLFSPDLPVTHCPFDRKDGLVFIAPLPKAVQNAPEVYLLVQRPRHGDPVSIKGLKLASIDRLPHVHRQSLRGIQLHRHVPVDFAHPFSELVDFYLIEQGEEWRYAVREETLGFYPTSELAEVRFTLFWRLL